MGRITKFVAGGNTYNFPTDTGDLDYQDNFAALDSRTKRLPGADGGYDELGDGRGLSGVGRIQFSFYLVSATREGMQALRDAARKMADWGVGRLYFQPTDPAAALRWTWARVDEVRIREDRHLHSDLFQRVQITFEASEPFWYTDSGLAVWGGGWTWGGGTLWGGGSVTAVTTSTTLSLTNNGNAYTQATISIKGGATPPSDILIRRMVEGEPVDEVRWARALSTGERLFIDCRRLGVWLEGQRKYDAAFSFRNPWWLRLLPGSNSIKVQLGSTGEQIDLKVNYRERWT